MRNPLSLRAVVPFESRRPGHGHVEWQPKLTYWLLGVIGGVFVLQFVVLGTLGSGWHAFLFLVGPDFYLRPWSLVTSTFAHSPVRLTHILFNGLVLYFFGPIVERIWGWRRMLGWFLFAGAVAGALQGVLGGGYALGASGALMMLMGVLAVVMPNEKLLIWGIVPVPFWAAAVGYAVIDILGLLGPETGIGHFAHLSGLAIGAALGWRTKRDWAARGVRLVRA